jgi:hypothetical protein
MGQDIMSEAINKKKDELLSSIKEEIIVQINELLTTEFEALINRLCANSRDDQLTKILGQDILDLIKEYRKIK